MALGTLGSFIDQIHYSVLPCCGYKYNLCQYANFMVVVHRFLHFFCAECLVNQVERG